MRIKTSCIALPLCAIVVFFSSCSAANITGTSDLQAEIQQSVPNPSIKNVISTKDGKLIYQTYQTIENNSASFYVMDLRENTLDKVGTIPKHIINTKAFVLNDHYLYRYITTENEDGSTSSKLYQIDFLNFKLTTISEDSACTPLIQLYQAPQGILALKIAANKDAITKTYFELIDPMSGNKSVALEAPSDETFVSASIYNNILYVFATKENASSDYDYFIKKYTIDGFVEQDVISLEPIQDYISQARIGSMNVIGSYLHMENYSNDAIIIKISGNSVSKVLEEKNLVYVEPSVPCDKVPVFYIRGSANCFFFDVESGKLQPIRLALKDGYVFWKIVADNEHIVIPTESLETWREDETKSTLPDVQQEEPDGVIYLYHYADFPNVAASTQNEA